MPYGFWGRLLEVDLSSEKVRTVEVSHTIFRRYLGGRGLATWILWQRLGSKWEEVDPLGPENILLVLTGPLTGYYPGSSRLCISGKSPQSCGVVGSTVASEVAVELKAAGYDGIIVIGASRDPVYLYIEDDRVEIRDASRVWGKGSRETWRYIYQDTKPDYARNGATTPPAFIYIGPAGENLVRTAAVMSKWVHAAGYGGYGAVMGSKKLKAIVVKGRGSLPPVAAPVRFKQLFEKVLDTLLTRQGMRAWGTSQGFWSVGYDLSSEPIRNWQEEWHDRREFAQHEFELGLCGIQTGNVMGLAFELYQRGILTKDDVGYELKWGDVKAAARLMEDIAYRRGIGEILAEGTYRAAREISRMKKVDVFKYAVQVKGIAVGAHGSRSGKDYPQPHAYTASVQGGDHTSVAPEQDSVFLDSAVICSFNTVDRDTMIGLLNAVTGWRVTQDELLKEIATRVLTLQRILLLLGGPDMFWDPRRDDDNPPRFYEPLPTGPYRGSKVDKNKVEELRKKYYEELGWDEYGIPKEETLKKLGIEAAAHEVKRIKKRLGIE